MHIRQLPSLISLFFTQSVMFANRQQVSSKLVKASSATWKTCFLLFTQQEDNFGKFASSSILICIETKQFVPFKFVTGYWEPTKTRNWQFALYLGDAFCPLSEWGVQQQPLFFRHVWDEKIYPKFGANLPRRHEQKTKMDSGQNMSITVKNSAFWWVPYNGRKSSVLKIFQILRNSIDPEIPNAS